MRNNDYVTASEIGDYVYCKRSWWLKFKGYSTGHTIEMEKGTRSHNSLSNYLSINFYIKVVGLVLLLVAVLALIFYYLNQ